MAEYIKKESIDFPWLQSGKIIDGELYVRLDEIYSEIKKLPTVDAAPVVHGRWERKIHWGICSICNAGFAITKGKPEEEFNYCPKCGAKMDRPSIWRQT